MKETGRVITFTLTDKKSEVNGYFPASARIGVGDECFLSASKRGTVSYVSASGENNPQQEVYVHADFPAGTAAKKGDKLYLCCPANAEPATEELPCAEAVGCVLRIGSYHYPARDIRSISTSQNLFGQDTVQLAFHDDRPQLYRPVADAKAVVRAWEVALRAPA